MSQMTQSQDSAYNYLNLPDFSDSSEITSGSSGSAGAATSPRRKIMIIISAITVIVLLGVTFAVLHGGKKTTPTTYTFQTLQTGNLAVSVNETGALQAATYVVDAASGSKIETLDVSVGQTVKSGQVLAKLDPTSLQNAYNQAQASVTSSEISYQNALNSLYNTQSQTTSSLTIAYDQEQNALSACTTEPNPPANCKQLAEAQYNQAQVQANAQVVSAQDQLNASGEQVYSAKLQLQTAQDNLNNATITAPHAGIVAVVNGVAGSLVSGSAGDFIDIVDLSSLQVLASVNEADVGSVAPNNPVTFTVTAYPSAIFQGTVAAVSPLGQSASGVVTYNTYINVNTQKLNGHKLFPGMTAAVTITTASVSGATLLPYSAVTFAQSHIGTGGLVSRTAAFQAFRQARQALATLVAQDKTIAAENPLAEIVLERSAKGVWTAVPVVVGITNGVYYETLSGLQPGDTVATGQSGGAVTTSAGSSTGGSFRRNGGGGGGFGSTPLIP